MKGTKKTTVSTHKEKKNRCSNCKQTKTGSCGYNGCSGEGRKDADACSLNSWEKSYNEDVPPT